MTGCERVLSRLRQGPATAAELYRLGVIVHSRVSDLRRQGHNITCVKRDGVGPESYLYTLTERAVGPSEAVLGGFDSQPPARSVSVSSPQLSLDMRGAVGSGPARKAAA